MIMFSLFINRSGVAQGVYDMGGHVHSVAPWGIVERTLFSYLPTCFAKIKNPLSAVEEYGGERFYIQRTFSLGDVLLTIPAIRALRRKGYDAVLRTCLDLMPLMEAIGVPTEPTNNPAKSPGLLADYLIELDHRRFDLSKWNRAALYMEAVGLDGRSEQADWSCDLSRFPALPIYITRPYVVVQTAGSSRSKRLPPETVCAVTEGLAGKGKLVVWIGDDRDIKVSEKVVKLGNRLRIAELFTLIASADGLVTMDSGPLWISHFTLTPVIMILGPTDWRQRLDLHPLYPEGTRWVELSREIGCKPCYENSVPCNGSWKCLSVAPGRVAELVMEKSDVFDQGVVK